MERNKKIIFIVVMFIVVSVIVICVQAFNILKRAVTRNYQYVQYNSIVASLELHKNEFGTYPPSSALDGADQHYCGAMKLSEALMGKDLKGFHKESVFRSDGMNESGIDKLYGEDVGNDPNVRIRPLLQIENANAYRLNEIYQNVGPFDGNNYVLCDIYLKKRHSGKKIGMPILYYKVNTSNTEHDVNNPDNPKNIYNYKDNHTLLSLGVPGKPKIEHPLFTNPKILYEMIRNWQISSIRESYREDCYTLLSAGKDGLYGTADDMLEWKYRK